MKELGWIHLSRASKTFKALFKTTLKGALYSSKLHVYIEYHNIQYLMFPQTLSTELKCTVSIG